MKPGRNRLFALAAALFWVAPFALGGERITEAGPEERSSDTYPSVFTAETKLETIVHEAVAEAAGWLSYQVPMGPTAYALQESMRFGLESTAYLSGVSAPAVLGARFRVSPRFTVGLQTPTDGGVGKQLGGDFKWAWLQAERLSLALEVWSSVSFAQSQPWEIHRRPAGAALVASLMSGQRGARVHFSLGASTSSYSYGGESSESTAFEALVRLAAVYEWPLSDSQRLYFSTALSVHGADYRSSYASSAYSGSYAGVSRRFSLLAGVGYQVRVYSSMGFMVGVEAGPSGGTFDYGGFKDASLYIQASGNGALFVEL